MLRIPFRQGDEMVKKMVTFGLAASGVMAVIEMLSMFNNWDWVILLCHCVETSTCKRAPKEELRSMPPFRR